MNDNANLTQAASSFSKDLLDDLTRRVEDIDNSYRGVAVKMGQLYLLAEEKGVTSLTSQLDKPMRNASENEQAFSALLNELHMQQNQR